MKYISFSSIKNVIKKRKIFFIPAAVILIAVIFFLRPKNASSIETYTVKKADLTQSLQVSGSVVAKKSVDLSFLTAGKLVYLGVTKGDSVEQNQTIAILDQRTIEKNIENAAKAYQNQKISFDIVNDFNGDRTLSDTGLSVSARRQMETALNTLDQIQIALQIQQLAKEQSILTTPISGIVTRADIKSVGVNAKLTDVFTIADPSSIVFDIDVDEADIGKVLVGQKVKITFDAYPDNTYESSVTSVDFASHTTSNGGNAYTVEVPLELATNIYRIGMNGNAEIIQSKKYHVLTVPLSSITDKKTVFVKTPRGFVEKKVTLGIESETDAEIIKGVTVGDVVAIQTTQVPKKQNRIPIIGRFLR